ncbi:MAG: MlaD family protein [Planctomycetes bacterium]|nr:MlaD family protein [Planctomycetota bacterium]
MLPVRKLEIQVGLLVVLALGATVTLVMSADRIRFERTYGVTALLKDSGGLREDSPVTLAGIKVGSVETIAPDPASGRIRARLKINASIDLPADLRARLASSGLFGDSSLAFAASGRPGIPALAKDGSAQVEVTPGFFDQAGERAERILDAAEDLLSAEARADAKRLLKSSADLAQHAAAVAARLERNGERMEALLADLQAAAADLRTVAAAAGKRVDPLLEHLDGAVVRLDQRSGEVAARAAALLDRVDALLAEQGPRLGEALAGIRDATRRVGELAGRIASGEGVLGQLVVSRELAATVGRVAVDVESAARAVADRPSVLVFDDAGTRARAEEARRNREKMRRTLDEGLAASAPASAALSR